MPAPVPPREIARLKIFAAPLLVVLALVVYAPALRAGFVWDDRALVLSDPLIRSWRLGWEGFQHFLFVDAGGSNFYRPLQRLSYLFDYAAFVFQPGGYHFVSVLWHAAAASAFFFFAEEMLRLTEAAERRRAAIAFAAAVVWLLHPVHNAAVAYISGRADPLAATFGFLGLFLALRMERVREGKRLLLGAASALALLASALSKEMGLLFLALLLVITIPRDARAKFRRALAIVAAVLVVYVSLRLPAQEEATPPATHTATPLLVRPVVVARAVAEYAALLVWPAHLHMEREVETEPFGFNRASVDAAAWRELQTLLGLLLIAAALRALWQLRHRSEIFLPLLLAAVSYLPVSGLFSLNASVAEHWLYLPSAFLFLGLAALAAEHYKQWPKLARAGLTIALLALATRTFVRAEDWKDQRTFLTRTIADGGDSARMWINLGGLDLSEGKLAAAQHNFQMALVKEPKQPLARINLAAVAIKMRDFAKARALLLAITEPPALAARAQESLVVLENRETGKVDLIRLRLAARLGPPNWTIEKRYISALVAAGLLDRALTELRTCLVLAPYRAESWQMMSAVWQKCGRPNEAALAFAEAERNDVHLNAHAALLP